MQSTRRYNHNYLKRLRENRSRAGKESQRVQALKRMVRAGEFENYEDACARAKVDRRGASFRHLVGCDPEGVEVFRLVLRYARSPARSDQFEVVEFRRSEWNVDVWRMRVWPKASAMGAILRRFGELLAAC